MSEPSYIDQAAEAVLLADAPAIGGWSEISDRARAHYRRLAEAAIGALPMKKRPFSSAHSEAVIAGQLKEIGELSAKLTAMSFARIVPAGHEPFVGHKMLWPHEVAEQIAIAIEPKRTSGQRGQALVWAAQVARALFPRPAP